MVCGVVVVPAITASALPKQSPTAAIITIRVSLFGFGIVLLYALEIPKEAYNGYGIFK